LASVKARYGKSEFETVNFALLALMSSYGIELLVDNVAECRENLLAVFQDFVKAGPDDDATKAARKVLQANIVHGDALTMTTAVEPIEPITFPEWTYLGKGKFHRRDFRFETMTQMSSFGEGTLFEDLGKHEIFVPMHKYPAMTMGEIAHG
jgi:hypothetical protein